MDNLQIFKERQINDYLSSIDLNDLDYNQIKKDLKSKLGEEPAIQFNYRKDSLLNEDGSKSDKKIEVLETVTIIFTVDREIYPGQTAPFPISKTFIIG